MSGLMLMIAADPVAGRLSTGGASGLLPGLTESIVPAAEIEMLTSADLFAPTIVAPAEIPIGILTAMLGAPCFLWLLRRRSVLL